MDRKRRGTADRRRLTRGGRRATDPAVGRSHAGLGMQATVLLVDDDDDAVEMYAIGLRLAGFRALATAPAAAAERAAVVQPDAIVLDLLLGERDGWQICAELAAVIPHVPVIILTAAIRPDGANRTRARQTQNCAAFVGKPCTPATLAAIIGRVCEGERFIQYVGGE
jgi:DNA-binding response OmpR family regulator